MFALTRPTTVVASMAPRRTSMASRAPTRPMRLPMPLRAVAADDESAMISGEWPVNWSLASYDDLSVFFREKFLKEDLAKQLSSIMKTKVVTVSPDTPLSEDLFSSYSGLPVVDSNGVLLGVISRKDLAKGGSVVGDVMNKQPIAAKRTAKVQDAAVLMLKHKVHRIPIVDDRARCIGIVTRFEIFSAMAEGL